jgi:hypothetical protein
MYMKTPHSRNSSLPLPDLDRECTGVSAQLRSVGRGKGARLGKNQQQNDGSAATVLLTGLSSSM